MRGFRLHLAVTLALVALAPARADLHLLAPRYAHSATLLPDGRVLISGGLGANDAFVDETELFDPATGQFTPGPCVHKARAFATATRLLDGTVLVAGGFVRPYSSSRTAERFDSHRFVFVERTMSAPREMHTATRLADGRVLITGGFVGGVRSLWRCDLFDPATRTFRPTGDLHFNRFGHAACLLSDGRVLITGGRQFPGDRTLDWAELYDSGTGRCSTLGRMCAARFRHTATVLRDGRVFITGGYSAAAQSQLTSTELLEPATGTFARGPVMATSRMDHTATLLPDGRVLIAGGFTAEGGPHTVASTEVFDPITGSFRPGPSLPVPVHEHQATLLPSGGVLITGGLQVQGGVRQTVSAAAMLAP